MEAKTIGILGLGSFSTLFYIKELNALYNQINGAYSTCPFKLLNTNFNDINNLLPKPSKELDGIVKNYLDQLLALGIVTLLVPNITLHETIDRLNLEVKIIHPIRYTISEIKKQGITKVVIFGSKYTMESEYIKSHFKSNKIKVVLVSEKDREFIDEVRKQVYQETASQELLETYNLLLEKYSKHTAVVIACTELSLVVTTKKLNVFDMARIQISEAVKGI